MKIRQGAPATRGRSLHDTAGIPALGVGGLAAAPLQAVPDYRGWWPSVPEIGIKNLVALGVIDRGENFL